MLKYLIDKLDKIDNKICTLYKNVNILFDKSKLIINSS